MILTDADINLAVEDGAIKIDPFMPTQIQPASYDLRVGPQGLTTSSNGLVNIEAKGFLELRPGDFGIIMTREIIEFDSSHVARIGLRSRYARKGIIATVGPQVDPGFKGRLKIGVTNLSPHVVTFPFEDDFITLEVHRLSKPSEKPYTGPYQGIDGISPDDITTVTEGENIGFSKMLDGLRSLSSNVAELSESVQKFTDQNKAMLMKTESQAEQMKSKFDHVLWLVGIGLAIISVIVALK